MFNLVGKRYLFLIISLIVIIPGTLSLLVKGLNIGIDFKGGSTLEFRPSQHVASTTAITNLLEQQLGLQNVQVNIGTNDKIPGNHNVWVRLNTDVDKDVQTAIKQALVNKYGGTMQAPNTPPLFDHLQLTSNGKTTTVTVITITSSSIAFKASDIEAVLNKLPNTTNTSQPSSVSPAATPTSAPSLKITPTVSATATPQATATASAYPTATATATSTSTTTNPAANIPVHVVDTRVGGTKDTINILTTTPTNQANVNQIQAAFINHYGNYLYTLDNSSVSGSVASDTIRNSILAVFAASVLILLYVWFAFRRVQKPWRYGACAIIALLHDVLVVMGVFSILGWLLGIQVDALFVTALLTVVGFSVHDTIVVFDRIRENMQRRSSETFEQIVNASLVQTMSRSLNTSLTVLFTLSALTLFGGESIRVFTFALLIGIFSGTYSSIFNASMLLVIWERGELGLWRLNRNARRPDGRGRPANERELVKSRG